MVPQVFSEFWNVTILWQYEIYDNMEFSIWNKNIVLTVGREPLMMIKRNSFFIACFFIFLIGG